MNYFLEAQEKPMACFGSAYWNKEYSWKNRPLVQVDSESTWRVTTCHVQEQKWKDKIHQNAQLQAYKKMKTINCF